jgi:hypothetical protein
MGARPGPARAPWRGWAAPCGLRDRRSTPGAGPGARPRRLKARAAKGRVPLRPLLSPRALEIDDRKGCPVGGWDCAASRLFACSARTILPSSACRRSVSCPSRCCRTMDANHGVVCSRQSMAFWAMRAAGRGLPMPTVRAPGTRRPAGLEVSAVRASRSPIPRGLGCTPRWQALQGAEPGGRVLMEDLTHPAGVPGPA